MKLNLANPGCGLQKTVDVDDEKMLLPFFEKRMGIEVPGDSIGDEFKGYIFRISGGNDKQGFPMMQGVVANKRVRLLFSKGMKCYRPRRTGEKKRKSVRGCIVGADLAVLNLVLVKKGEKDIPGLTDGDKPRRLGPKRASHIRKLFNLTKEDDVRKYVVFRKIEGKKNSKAPKIQRLITANRLQRKRVCRNSVKNRVIASREAHKEYEKLLEKRRGEMKEKRAAEIAKKKKATVVPKKAVVAPKKAAVAPKKAAVAPKKAAVAPKKAAVAPKKAAVAPKKA